jgi:PleD family two-component response regulator
MKYWIALKRSQLERPNFLWYLQANTRGFPVGQARSGASQNEEESLNWSTEAIFAKHKVPVVDDHRHVRELVYGHLQELDYRVLSAKSREEASELKGMAAQT